MVACAGGRYREGNRLRVWARAASVSMLALDINPSQSEGTTEARGILPPLERTLCCHSTLPLNWPRGVSGRQGSFGRLPRQTNSSDTLLPLRLGTRRRRQGSLALRPRQSRQIADATRHIRGRTMLLCSILRFPPPVARGLWMMCHRPVLSACTCCATPFFFMLL